MLSQRAHPFLSPSSRRSSSAARLVPGDPEPAVQARRTRRPAPSGVTAFLKDANDTLLSLGKAANEAGWVQSTFITTDTQAISARTNEAYVTAATNYAKKAATFPAGAGTPDEQRQLTVLKNTMTMAAPADPAEAAEMTRLGAALEAAYGSGKYCPAGRRGRRLLPRHRGGHQDPGGEPRPEAAARGVGRVAHDLAADEEGLRAVRRADEQGRARRSASPTTASCGARDTTCRRTPSRRSWIGSGDSCARSTCRCTPTCGRGCTRSTATPFRRTVRFPAHLLGNIWAQDWSNVYDLVAPPGGARSVPLDDILKARRITPVDMTKFGEGFFTSLGFEKLPQTFWERSLLTKPRDREVVCHASAWDIDLEQDVRIKMCIDPTAEDFTTIHHELGHNFYQRAYRQLPVILRDSANDGFHEAIGDTIALSVTPEYLVKVGLLKTAPDASGDVGLLMQRALDKLAFLPFGLVVDQWRWKVFSGEVRPRRLQQGLVGAARAVSGRARAVARAARSSSIRAPSTTCRATRRTPATSWRRSCSSSSIARSRRKPAAPTPLHRCSIYGSAAAGARLQKALAMGASKPWPDVLEALTGERQMDAVGDRRLLRAAQDVARRAEREHEDRLVERTLDSGVALT